MVRSDAVLKKCFFKEDEFIVEKWRGTVEKCFLTLPEHLSFAQGLLGKAVGLGIRSLVHCSIRNRRQLGDRVTSQCQLLVSDSINVMPFEVESEEIIRRGLIFSYFPDTNLLSIVIRFRKIHGEAKLIAQFKERGITVQEDDIDDDVFPLHSDIPVHGHLIRSIHLRNGSLLLADGSIITIREAVDNI